MPFEILITNFWGLIPPVDGCNQIELRLYGESISGLCASFSDLISRAVWVENRHKPTKWGFRNMQAEGLTGTCVLVDDE